MLLNPGYETPFDDIHREPPEGSPYEEVFAFAQRFVDAGKG